MKILVMTDKDSKNTSAESINDRRNVHTEQIGYRDPAYSQIIDALTTLRLNEAAFRPRYKKIYFWFTICVFVAILVASFYVVLFVIHRDPIPESIKTNGSQVLETNYMDIGALVAAAASIITAILKFPEIIAKHLFPEQGEKSEEDIIKTIINYDKYIANEGDDTSL